MISTLTPDTAATNTAATLDDGCDTRYDGWTPARQRAFVSHLADHGSIAAAAKAAGMGLSGAYAFRRRRAGFAFNLAWQAALIMARDRLIDTLMMRAIDGEEIVTVREEGVSRRRAANYRLGLSLLDRIHPDKADPAVKIIIADFEAFLGVLDQGGTTAALERFFRLRMKNRMLCDKLVSTLPLVEECAGSAVDYEVKSMDGLASGMRRAAANEPGSAHPSRGTDWRGHNVHKRNCR